MIEIKGKIGKYQIMKKLGSGGFGTVYLAEDTFLKTQRALKIPHRIGSQTEKLLEESALQSKLLDHPNIVKLLTVDIIDNIIIMVMEYIKGTDLEKLIDSQNRLEIPAALKYLRQILSAIQFAQDLKVIHRDIRPSNILIDEDDNVKIADFGTSTILNDRQYATTRIGSPPYMAPEQFEGRAVLASDIYSVGCLFYEMATGFPPIVLANPMEIYKKAKAGQVTPLIKKVPAVSPGLNRIAMKMLSPDLNLRYKQAGEIIEDLNQLENRRDDYSSQIKAIKNRIDARESRTDFFCWNCRKAMPRQSKKCIYCGAEQ
jgi:serine/threonine protein kinase